VNRVLVFGTTGFLGKTFFLEPTDSLIPINRKLHDFTQPINDECAKTLEHSRATAAIITTAMSSPDECLKNPELSENINVTGTIALLNALKKLKIKPVFFSTDHVFDGQRGLFTESDDYCPITLYGRQKTRTETYIRENFSDYLILRTSKQIAMRVDPKNILSELGAKLRAGQVIRCATDSWITPAFVEDIVKTTLALIEMDAAGIFHVAPDSALSRFELGLKLARAFDVSPELVRACSMADFNLPEARPPRCTLNGAKLRDSVGVRMKDVDSGIVDLRKRLDSGN
jgi:dTDP-4-dehydrorhamnose reductase